MKRTQDFLFFLICLLVCMLFGALLHKHSQMSCNDALRAGFRIYDADGFEVERFDECDYWTTTPKP